MTTETTPEKIWACWMAVCPDGCILGKWSSVPDGDNRESYTRTAWLIERLEGMKVIRRHGQDQRDLDYCLGSNPHEMALRIAEASIGLKRPDGADAKAILDKMREDFDPAMVAGFYRAALAAAKYLEESINDYQRVQ